MRVLLTGATGFIGSHLTRALLMAHHDVIILKRSFSNTLRISDLLQDLTVYDLDHCKLEQPFLDFGRIDSIIHTATCYGRAGQSSIEVLEANLVMPLRLVELAIFFNTGTFLNTATFGNDLNRLYKPLSFYSLSKSQFEDWGKMFGHERKIRFVNIRLEYPYGPGEDYSRLATSVIRSCLSDEHELRLTPGQQKWDFIFIDDVVSAYMTLLSKAQDQPIGWFQYGLGSGRAISIRVFVETVKTITRSKTELLFGALPYRDAEIMHSQADIRPLQSLGWSCKTNIEQGIQNMIEKAISGMWR